MVRETMGDRVELSVEWSPEFGGEDTERLMLEIRLHPHEELLDLLRGCARGTRDRGRYVGNSTAKKRETGK